MARNYDDLNLKSDNYDEDDYNNRTPPQKAEKNQRQKPGEYKFNDEWLKNEQFEVWIIQNKDDSNTVLCRVCKIKITIKYRSISALKDHIQTERHRKNIHASKSSNVISQFFRKSDANSTHNNSVIISELILTYHAIKHHHSYLSQDCGNKLHKLAYNDSKNAHKLSCGRTKAESLVELVLAPYSLEIILKIMKDSPYSICTDASNKGNRKMFPITVRFFDKEKGTLNAILDFYEDPDETSQAIANQLLKCINNVGLSPRKLVSYGADNAAVNFGKNNSVFVHLKKKANLPSLVAGHCNVHILHNTVKFGLQLLSHDVENLVLKVYAVFSSSAKENKNLKEFCSFVDSEYSTILRHVPTRFLSLYPAVNRLLLNWVALKSYFKSKGKENVNKAIWKFVGKNESSVDNEVSLAELYIYFVHNIMHLFQNIMKHVESNYIQSTEVFTIFSKLRTELRNRIEKRFFGFKVNQSIHHLSITDRDKFENECVLIYGKMITYLQKWFDFSETSFFAVSRPFNLDATITLEQACNVGTLFGISFDDVGDELFSEICLLNEAIPLLTGTNSSEKWIEYFKISNSPILLQLCKYIFAVPPNNCYVERIFSVMGNIWTHERNRLQVEMVKSELFIHFNYQMTCNEFAIFIRKNTPENNKIIAAAKSNEKYKYKFK